MKSFTLKKKSLHYRLANTYGPLDDYEDSPDFCSYVRCVLMGCFWVLMLILFCGVVSGHTGAALGWGAAWIVTGQYVKPIDPIMITVIIYAVFAIVALGMSAFIQGGNYLEHRKQVRLRKLRELIMLNPDAKYEEPKPSFLKLAYGRFKDKTCFKIQLN